MNKFKEANVAKPPPVSDSPFLVSHCEAICSQDCGYLLEPPRFCADPRVFVSIKNKIEIFSC